MSLRAKRMIKMVQDRQNENPPVNQQHQGAENDKQDTSRTEHLPQASDDNLNGIVAPTETLLSSEAGCDIMERVDVHIAENLNQEMDPFESFDDSIEDPNFALDNSESSDADTDSSINFIAMQIENALGSCDDSHAIKSKRKRKKINRNLGKSYQTKKGRIVQERKYEPLEICQKKCQNLISPEEQKQLFEHYWSLGSYNQRILYIASFIEIKEKKTQKLHKSAVAPRNRLNTMEYSVTVNGIKTIVCQKCFMKCFGETASFLKSVIKKKIDCPNLPLSDRRGKIEPHNKFCEQTIEAIKQHINSFPSYESHYSRRHTSMKYLHADLTISKMHSLYCEKSDKPVSITKYSEIFKGMSLKFKSPSNDTCKTCDILKTQIDIADPNSETKHKLILDQKAHHLEADLAYKSKENDKIKARNSESTKTYAFDLQQCLPTPYLQNSLSFYKRQLWTYNLTVHDCATNNPYCYMWHEADGARGGNNIASCLFRHLKSLPINNKSVTFYSDSCAGQNKNSHVAAMFLAYIENSDHVDMIDHKFLVPGHTHMECDIDHALIERKKKKTSVKIHHPRDWYQFIRSVGSKQLFKVIEMTGTDFYNFSGVMKNKFMWRSTDENSEKFIWKNVKWLRYTKEDFGIIKYKNSLNDEEPFKRLNIRRRGIRTINYTDIENENYSQTISTEKKKDLMSLLPFIDPCFHTFYKDLKTVEMINTHPDLVEEDNDDY